MDEGNIEADQQARSELRERFLRVIGFGLQGKVASFKLHENISVEASIVSTDANMGHVLVKDLHTAIGIQPTALLRASDIISFKIDFQWSIWDDGWAAQE